MGNKQLTFLRFILALSDILLLNMCLFVGSYLSNKYGSQNEGNFFIDNVLPVNAVWGIVTSFFRLYEECTIFKLSDVYKATWRSVVLHIILFKMFLLITSSTTSREFDFIFSGLLILSFIIGRFILMTFENIFNFNFNDRILSIMAVSSMGGHWTELLRLMPLFKKHNVTFVSNKKNLAQTVEGYKFYTVRDANKDTKMDLIICFVSVLTKILVLRPRVIITTGAAPGLLSIIVGKFLGIKTIWIDSIANAEKLSLSGSVALRIADKVYTQWEHLSTPKIEYSGSVI
jgi:FlaA1/EpsC-like NDP-sugar epimerase